MSEPTVLLDSVSTSLEGVRVRQAVRSCSGEAWGRRGETGNQMKCFSAERLFSIQDLFLFLRHFTSTVFQHLGLCLGPGLVTLRSRSFPPGFSGAPLLGALFTPIPTLAASPPLLPLPTAALFPLTLTSVILSFQTQTKLHHLKKAVTSGPQIPAAVLKKNSVCYLEVLCPVCSVGIYTPWRQILVRSTTLEAQRRRSSPAAVSWAGYFSCQ